MERENDPKIKMGIDYRVISDGFPLRELKFLIDKVEAAGANGDTIFQFYSEEVDQRGTRTTTAHVTWVL